MQKLKPIVSSLRLSKAGKMPCPSWSLQAIDTCPGSIGEDGELVAACSGCYATDGNYRFPNVKAPRIHNREDWKRPEFEDDMVAALSKEDYFRWFDSGDMYSLALAKKLYRIMKRSPHCRFWLPTRMHKFDKFRPIINKMNRLKNVTVRRSSDDINGGRVRGISSTIFDANHPSQAGNAFVCPAYSRDGKCGDCRACWDSSIPVIAYPQHGRKMAKVNRDIIAIAA